MNISEAKRDLAQKTKKGFPVIIAGLLFWIVASVTGVLLSEKQVVWVYLIGMGCVFPLGLMIAALLKIDMFAKGNPLGTFSWSNWWDKCIEYSVCITCIFSISGVVTFCSSDVNRCSFFTICMDL